MNIVLPLFSKINPKNLKKFLDMNTFKDSRKSASVGAGKNVPSKKPGRLVQSVQRALAIVEILGDHPEGLGLRDLAEAAGLAPQTVQSLVRTLQAGHWVTQEAPGHPYRIGPSCARLARSWRGGGDLAARARPFVEALAEETGEYVLLATLQQGAVIRLLEIEGNRPLRVFPPAEARSSPHTMATGKVLMAFLREPEQQEMLRKIHDPPPSRESRAPVNESELRRQLHRIRKQAFAECIEENGEGIVAVAVPVRSRNGTVIAALGLSLPTLRYMPPFSETLRPRLEKTAGEIENTLAFFP